MLCSRPLPTSNQPVPNYCDKCIGRTLEFLTRVGVCSVKTASIFLCGYLSLLQPAVCTGIARGYASLSAPFVHSVFLYIVSALTRPAFQLWAFTMNSSYFVPKIVGFRAEITRTWCIFYECTLNGYSWGHLSRAIYRGFAHEDGGIDHLGRPFRYFHGKLDDEEGMRGGRHFYLRVLWKPGRAESEVGSRQTQSAPNGGLCQLHSLIPPHFCPRIYFLLL